jgi:hypothetical protein
MTKFEKQFKAAHAVSTPLVTVRTFDAKSTLDHISNMQLLFGNGTAQANSKLAIILWDCVNGMSVVNPKTTILDGKLTAKDAFQAALNNAGTVPDATADLPVALRVASFIGEETIVFISNAHLFWSEAPVLQGIWNLRNAFKAWGSMLVLMTGNGAILPSELANDFLVLDEPLPTHEELGAIVRDTFSFASLPAPSDDTIRDATQALIGLPAFTAEQSAAMCLDVPAKVLDMSGLWERKRQAINQTRGLSVLETDAKLENIGGLGQFKEYLERIMNGDNPPNVILLWDEIEKSFAGMGTDTSGVTTKLGGNVLSWSNDTGMKGIIAVGIPGAGKTEVVKAIANKYGKLCIAFNLADMESGIVGSSNEYLRNAQAIVDSISDKRVLSIATCNKIDSLPAEIQRRFANKGIFFFDVPDAANFADRTERNSIWDIYQKQYKLTDTTLPDDRGWTGAEIRNCAMNASELHISVVEASQYIIPVTHSNAASIETLRRSCDGKYLSASHPGAYKAMRETTSSAPEVSGRKMR